MAHPEIPLTCNLKIAMQAGKPTMYQVHFTWLIASHRTQWAASIEEAFFQTCRWLNLCTRNGITLNPKKFQFAEDTIEFTGITVTSTNIKPSTKFLNSIKHFPTPTDILGARGWFGIVNQGTYAFAMAKRMKPFRHLLRPATKFNRTDELDTFFKQSKEVIIKEVKEGMRLFDLSRTTWISTDWSVDGVGFLLKQKYCQCPSKNPSCCQDGWKLLGGQQIHHPR